MGRLFIPKASSSSSVSSANATTANDPGNRVLPMPQRLGVCLDYDAGRVYFYDADTMRCLYERQVDCSGTMYPAFGLMGSGKVQLEEFITAKRLTFWGGWSAFEALGPASVWSVAGFSDRVMEHNPNYCSEGQMRQTGSRCLVLKVKCGSLPEFAWIMYDPHAEYKHTKVFRGLYMVCQRSSLHTKVSVSVNCLYLVLIASYDQLLM